MERAHGAVLEVEVGNADAGLGHGRGEGSGDVGLAGGETGELDVVEVDHVEDVAHVDVL